MAIDEFIAPSEDVTDASVSASVLKYFDGDDLAAADPDFYGDYAGWAVTRIRFTFENSAAAAVYTIYPKRYIEDEGFTDEEIRKSLLDDELLDVYNFMAEGITEVLLEWGHDYRLYAVPFDSEENAGELYYLDIPALDKKYASPIIEY